MCATCVRHEEILLKTSRTIQIVIYSEKKGSESFFLTGKRLVSEYLEKRTLTPFSQTGLPGGNSGREPPDPISNSEVKTFSADGSVGSPHVRVGHRQALNSRKAAPIGCGFSFSKARLPNSY